MSAAPAGEASRTGAGAGEPAGEGVRVAVVGAGAVGCYYGGMLARAGVPVTLIGRPVHVAAIRRDGLRLTTATFDEHVRLAAATEPSAVAGAALVLVCVKSPDTESTGLEIAPHLAPGARRPRATRPASARRRRARPGRGAARAPGPANGGPARRR